MTYNLFGGTLNLAQLQLRKTFTYLLTAAAGGGGV